MEFIECIFCKRYSDRVVITENGYTGRKCPICNLVYISHRPSFSETLNYSIRKLLAATGFELIKIYGYSKMGYLFTQKYLKQLKLMSKSLRAKKNKITNRTEKLPIEYGNREDERNLFLNAKEYLLYLLAYKIGYFIPKNGYPQTLIVIARKKA